MDLKIVSCLTAGYSAGFDGLLLQAQKGLYMWRVHITPPPPPKKKKTFLPQAFWIELRQNQK